MEIKWLNNRAGLFLDWIELVLEEGERPITYTHYATFNSKLCFCAAEVCFSLQLV